jgi:hypothetical protein
MSPGTPVNRTSVAHCSSSQTAPSAKRAPTPALFHLLPLSPLFLPRRFHWGTLRAWRSGWRPGRDGRLCGPASCPCSTPGVASQRGSTPGVASRRERARAWHSQCGGQPTRQHAQHSAQCMASPPRRARSGGPRLALCGSLRGQPARQPARSATRCGLPWPCAPWRSAFAQACSPAGVASGPHPVRRARVPARRTFSRRAHPVGASPSPSTLSSRLPRHRRALAVRSSPSPLAEHPSSLCDVPR